MMSRSRSRRACLALWTLVALLAMMPLTGQALAAPSLQQVDEDQGPGAGQDQDEDQAGQQEEERQRYEETVVVTASRTRELLIETPTATSVIDSASISIHPAQNYADLLRGVPGLNVTQTSARDVNLSSRSATGTLDASQLVLIDGRSVYQDFFGFVAWDLLPLDFSEIEQIEIIRGPGSAVWGANAMSGVVNIITKTPRQMGEMFHLRAGGGEQGTGFGSITWSNVEGDLAYRFTGSYYTQEPWARPGPLPNGTPRDLFRNEGTKQPKMDFRADYRMGDTDWLSFSGGWAGTGGIIHTGIGPFTIHDDTTFWYGRGDYNHGDMNFRLYANILDGDATNLLNGLPFSFESQTYDVSFQDSVGLFDDVDWLTYGGNYRALQFDLSIAPDEDSRSEGGVFVQNELALGDYVTLNAGARVDWFSVLDDPVFSPRGAILVSPTQEGRHVFRFSYGRAYRAPSLINNFLDVTIFNQVSLPLVGPYVFPSSVQGNPALTESNLDQFEIGYRGVFGEVSVDIAAYRTETEDQINFVTTDLYTFLNPPPGLPDPLRCLLPGAFVPPCPPGPPLLQLPSRFSYINAGTIDNQGIEVGVQARPFRRQQVQVNYSWQDEPDFSGITASEVNIPPEHRFNVSWSGWAGSVYYGASVHYVDEAFWSDVLDARFNGFTDSYTTLDASLGYLFLDGTAELSLRATNLTDEKVLQHVFGDVIGRRIVGELSVFIR